MFNEPAIYIALTLAGASIAQVIIFYLFAKILGIQLEEIGIFFFGRTDYRIKRTDITIGWLALGGYVKPQKHDDDAPTTDPEDYNSHPHWKRALFSASSTLSLLFVVLLCLLLANPAKPFMANVQGWLSEMGLFISYLVGGTDPNGFIDALWHLSSRELLFLTAASWLAIPILNDISPAGQMGRAILNYFKVYDSTIGASLVGLIVVGITLFWVYLFFMVGRMVVITKGWDMLGIILFDFVFLSVVFSLVLRGIFSFWSQSLQKKS